MWVDFYRKGSAALFILTKDKRNKLIRHSGAGDRWIMIGKGTREGVQWMEASSHERRGETNLADGIESNRVGLLFAKDGSLRFYEDNGFGNASPLPRLPYSIAFPWKVQ